MSALFVSVYCTLRLYLSTFARYDKLSLLSFDSIFSLNVMNMARNDSTRFADLIPLDCMLCN